jgi:hypothetical protein
MVKKIILKHGQISLVDDADFEWASQHTWYGLECSNTCYAMTSIRQTRGKWKLFLMHRLLLKVTDKQKVDHENGNGLDNQRGNLRIATRSQNSANSRKHRRETSSQFKGVNWIKTKWRAYITANGVRHWLGYFDDEVAAAMAYDVAAREYFGEFARLNFPDKR